MSNKWSSFKKQQMIMENWRKYTEGELLTEKANAAAVDPQRFPTKLSQVAADVPDAQRDASLGTDDGDPQDDVIDVTPNYTAPVVKLKPSQTSMNIGKAAGMALSMLAGKMDAGGNLGAFISNDGYIMDGHHRWVSTAMVDPSKEVGGYLVDFPGIKLIAILNAVTVGKLGIKVGKDGSGGFDQFKLAPIEAQLTEYYQNGIPGKFPWTPEEVQAVIHEHGGGEGEQAISGLANKFAANAAKLTFAVPSGAPARPDMPVIDPDKVPGAIKTAVTALTGGEVDVNEPYGQALTKAAEE